jgi:DNA-binding GntR family transcriptional regulator
MGVAEATEIYDVRAHLFGLAGRLAASRISLQDVAELRAMVGDSDEADRHSELIAITVPGWIRSVVGAKRRWRMDFAESDRDRQACCC